MRGKKSKNLLSSSSPLLSSEQFGPSGSVLVEKKNKKFLSPSNKITSDLTNHINLKRFGHTTLGVAASNKLHLKKERKEKKKRKYREFRSTFVAEEWTVNLLEISCKFI